ncbi:HNH endonuclease signature motif containing protein [Streptomyces sp. NPDC052225]|uniref:HNH endonuclease n=1 Tax=Streptomyces sp. NPDC052225 TaxID=3154949 RepID=UPI003425F456
MPDEATPPLPQPDSPELQQLLPLDSVRALYGFLFARQDSPPTTDEIHEFIAQKFDKDQSEAMRRLRSLRERFTVERTQRGRDHYYRLAGWKQADRAAARVNLSGRLRAQVLAPQRCAQCGRVPLEDKVKLVVDHKIPVAWGGSDDISNLQPLCEECNGGKRDFYATYDPYAEQIAAAALHDEPHGRIGELLKALEGQWVPAELIGVVASMKQYQDDWERRLRELRELDWTYQNRVRRPRGRPHLSEYKLTHWEPWPEGRIKAEIDKRKKLKKRRGE